MRADTFELSWCEIEELLLLVWETPEQVAEQASWIRELGWRVQELDREPLPTAYDGSTVAAIVLHPTEPLSPGSLRFLPQPKEATP